MHFASFVLNFATLFATDRAGGHGGFTATCTNINFGPSLNLAADCYKTTATSIARPTHRPCSPMTGIIISCNCAGMPETIDVDTCVFNNNGQLNC
ncbi:hypothetical protein B0H19DRAFT_1256242 [Mycena capillaripes]|nr:hypothetical protein B0H19DRAFT_1256242 [Mycena capillaripes]